MNKSTFQFTACATALLLMSAIGWTQTISVTPDKADGVYQAGDTVQWTIKWQGETPPPAARYTLKSGGLTTVGEGELSFANNIATLQLKFEAPNTLLLDVNWQGESKTNHSLGGAVASPAQIQAAAAPPADFDAFWQSKLAELAQIPINPRLEPGDAGRAGASYSKVTLDNIRGTQIHGQLARPATGEKFPALLILQWAGVYGLQKGWAVDRAADGWLALNIEPHDIPIDNPPAFYAEQSKGPLQNYWTIGNDDREKSYYLRMYLGCVQAARYLQGRPDWDGKTLVVMGTSQGGQQALATAGLMPGAVTAVLPFLPAAADMLAPEIGRASGFPNWYAQTWGGRDAQAVHETSKYFDPINFARRIKAPVFAGLGLVDDVAPPSSILAALNAIEAPKEVLILANAGHQNENGAQNVYTNRLYGAWLPALQKGQPAPIEKTSYDAVATDSMSAVATKITALKPKVTPKVAPKTKVVGKAPASRPKAASPVTAAKPAAFAATGASPRSFETGQYRNLFREIGHSDAEINAKISAAWQQLFYGSDDSQRVYYPVGTDMAYIKDIGSNDVRTEGMSYGMMISVQLGKREEFDRLWKWAKTYMYHPSGPRRGYFAWSCFTDGKQRDAGSASDGEEYFAMALFFADARWGSSKQGIFNYRSQADALLHTMLHKEEENGGRIENVTNLFDRAQKQVVFAPSGGAASFTDPSYHLPAFYELWSRWAAEDRDFWRGAAHTSRQFFQKTTHPQTGLAPDYAAFSGAPLKAPWDPQSTSDHFKSDAFRVGHNIAMDYAWFGADPWQVGQSNRMLEFFAAQKPAYVAQYTVEGQPIVTYGSTGLAAMNAVSTLAATTPVAPQFVRALWDAEVPSGQWRYYDGLLYLFGLLHAGGQYRIYAPKALPVALQR